MTTMYHENVYKAIFAGWNDKQKEGLSLLEGRKKYPREFFEYIGIKMTKSFISGSKDDRMDALKLLKDAEKVTKGFLSSDSKMTELAKEMNNGKLDDNTKLNWSLDCKLVAAEITFFKALMQLQLGSILKGAINLRSSWKSFLSVQKEVDAHSSRINEDIKLGLKYNTGVFMFMVSFSPGMFLKVLELLGFVANRDLGIQYLKEVEKSTNIRAPQAALFLCFNYLVLPRGLSKPEENLIPAEKLLNEMRIKYPTSSFFLWMSSTLYSKQGELDKAVDSAKKALEACAEYKVAPNSYLSNLAILYVMKRDWKNAAETFEAVCAEKAGDFEIKGLCGVQLAACYFMMEQEDKAKKTLERVPSMVSKHSRYDKLAEKKVSQFKKRGFGLTQFEVLYLRRDLHHLGKEDSEEMLKVLDKQYGKLPVHKETDGVYMLMKAVLYKNMKDEGKAMECLHKILAMEKEVKEDTWIFPNTHYEIAETSYFNGNLDEAEKHLRAAKSYNGYDFQEMVGSRINFSFEIIKKEKLSKGMKVEEEKKETQEVDKDLAEKLRSSKLAEDSDDDLD